MKPSRWAPLAAAGSVVAVAAAIALLTHTAGPSDPPLLRLAGGATSDAAAAPVTAKLGAAGDAFRLVGTLPSGPEAASAQDLPAGPAARRDVAALASALGQHADPVRDGDGWRAGDLLVSGAVGQPWQLSRCAPVTPVSSGGSVSSGGGSSDGTVPPDGAVASVDCSAGVSSSGSGTAASGSGTASTGSAAPLPPPEPSPAPTIDPAAVRRAVAPVLAALHLTDARVRVEPWGAAVVDPVVDGLPTVGFSRFEVDAQGRFSGGSGFLAAPTRGASYPLVSAREAFDALPDGPGRLSPDCADCPSPSPAAVTGAELGLQLTWLRDDEAALLPAWLFQIRDWPQPLAQNAVQPRFLVQPSPPSTGGRAPVPTPAGGRAPLGFDAAYPTDDPKAVIVQYGDSGRPHAGVTAQAKESADSVVVILEAEAQPSEQACTSDYRQVLVTVPLQQALGRRTVIDASRGEPVAVDRSCARPMGNPPPPKDCVR